MRNPNNLPAPVRLVAAVLAPVLGSSALAGCGSGSGKPNQCLTTPVLSRVYEGSTTHKGLVVTIPRLGSQAISLDVGFRTASGAWDDSYPIPEPFLAKADQRIVVGIKGGPVQFRFAEVVSSGQSERPKLGSVEFSAQTTEQAALWLAVRDIGALPKWPHEPSSIPIC
jgi:hypothetical protein